MLIYVILARYLSKWRAINRQFFAVTVDEMIIKILFVVFYESLHM